MADHNRILKYLEKTSHLFPGYIFTQLKKNSTLDLISRVIAESGKEPSEAVIVFLTAIRYLLPGSDAFIELEKTDSFQEFIINHADTLVDLAVRKKVQGNLPGRGLPLLEIFSKKIPTSTIAVIELGASYGLIGRCLLEPIKLIENRERYFSAEQEFSKESKGIDYYLGIDLDPPDKEWLLACAWWGHLEKRLRNLLADIQPDARFQLIKANAFGFSGLKPVRELLGKSLQVVILTSFMLYQLDEAKQKQLKDDILKFTAETGAHWINQYVYVPASSPLEEYYIEWDGKRLIKLPDDKCVTWKWLEPKI